MKQYRNPIRFPRATRRGFTVAEMVVAVAVLSMVMVAVLALQVITARTLKDLHLPTLSRSARMIAFNQLRYRLADGAVGSCVEFPDEDYTRIEFHDPNQGAGVVSAFYFEPPDESSGDRRQKTQGFLYYTNDVDSDPEGRVVAVGPVIVNFRLGREESPGVFVNTQSLVTLHVKTLNDLGYSRVDERDGEIVVYLRNPAVD